MNSKLKELLSKDYLTDVYGKIIYFVMVDGDLNSKLDAEKAIRQAVGEEILGLKPNNPYKTTDGQVPESFEAPAHAYDVANGDWEQKIKQWQGGEDV